MLRTVYRVNSKSNHKSYYKNHIIKKNYAAEITKGEEYKIRNPATGTVFESIRLDTIQSLEEKIELAKDGKQQLKDLGLEKRIEAVNNFSKLLQERKEDLSALLTRETGKPITMSRNELSGTIDRIEFFVKNIHEVTEDIVVHEANGMKEIIEHEPLGIIGNISAWNYPYFVGTNVYIPALLTGSSVLYKPSEHSSVTGLKMAELLHEAGVPQNAFQTLIGGADIGKALVKSGLDGIFFTGSHKVGKEVASVAFQDKLVERIQLELGGKDPVYVHEDVDIESTAAAVLDGAFYNNGQSCCSIERIYVHESIHDQFVESFVEQLKAKKIGDPVDEEVYFGPLTRSAQIKTLLKQVEDAKANGGIILTGGKSIESPEHVSYMEPTVIVNANHQMLLMTEETFGPVIGIMKVANTLEAQTLMADTEYGLTASVYSKDQKIAKDILGNLNVGTAYWNTCDRVSPRLPWSGRKDSGIGVTLSLEGLRTFVIPKAWHLKSLE